MVETIQGRIWKTFTAYVLELTNYFGWWRNPQNKVMVETNTFVWYVRWGIFHVSWVVQDFVHPQKGLWDEETCYHDHFPRSPLKG